MKVKEVIEKLNNDYPQDDEIAVWIWDKINVFNIANIVVKKEKNKLSEKRLADVLCRFYGDKSIGLVMINSIVKHIFASLESCPDEANLP